MDDITKVQAGPIQTLGCFFYQAIYFDVPISPNPYDVMAEGTLVDTVHFDGPGEQKTVSGWAVVVGWSFDT